MSNDAIRSTGDERAFGWQDRKIPSKATKAYDRSQRTQEQDRRCSASLLDLKSNQLDDEIPMLRNRY